MINSYLLPVLWLADVGADTIDTQFVVDLAASNQRVQWAREDATRQALMESVKLGVLTAVDQRIRMSPDQLAIREVDPQRDLGLPGTGWRTPRLAEGNTYLNVIARYNMPPNVVMVVYGVFSLDPDPVITQVRLSLGVGASTIYGVYALEPLYWLPARFALLAQVLRYRPNETVHISVSARADKPEGERFGLAAIVVEPVGMSVSGRD